jgi:1-acyl-sn-glycerol-3-phosphate acyltransferase
MPFRLSSLLVFPVRCLYGLYVLVVFALLGLGAFALLLVPGISMDWRRHIARGVARAFFFIAGIPVRKIDERELPATPCVIVANHASYLDGVVMKAALPARFSFVIKKEFARVPIAGLLLRRIGSEFVDRFNRHAGAMDARRLMKVADKGQSLVFFPEGTFVARPGLGKFHTGAFVIAARAGLSVVPVAIRGTRHILAGDGFLPRPGTIEIQFLPLINAEPDADPGATAVTTRERSRAAILCVVNEPDLAQSDGLARFQAQQSATPAALRRNS